MSAVAVRASSPSLSDITSEDHVSHLAPAILVLDKEGDEEASATAVRRTYSSHKTTWSLANRLLRILIQDQAEAWSMGGAVEATALGWETSASQLTALCSLMRTREVLSMADLWSLTRYKACSHILEAAMASPGLKSLQHKKEKRVEPRGRINHGEKNEPC